VEWGFIPCAITVGMGDIMSTKTKTFVVLAFVVAAFYTLEAELTVIDKGLVGPVFIKVGIVAACLYFAISKITESKTANAPGSE